MKFPMGNDHPDFVGRLIPRAVAAAAMLVCLPDGAVAAAPADREPPVTAPARPDPVSHPHPVAMPKRETIEASITRGVDFLLATQNRDGSWGSATHTKGLNIYAPVPGAHLAFRAAVSALAVSALIESRDARPTVAAALDRGDAWLLENLPKVRRANATALYNNWTHAYGIGALARLHARAQGNARHQREIEEVIRQQVDRLGRYAFLGGGWGYYDFESQMQRPGDHVPSFTTATVLLALKEAQRLKIDVPRRLVDQGLAALKRQQKPDFTYLYSGNMWGRPMLAINQPGGSLGRSQVCNLALRRWGDSRITDRVLEDWLERLFARNMWLDLGRKRPVPHESYFMVAGYFFFYGHYYASQCIDELPAARRAPHQAQLAARLLKLQEKDGSWWDFPLYNYHQAYGTSFALMSLARCRGE